MRRINPSRPSFTAKNSSTGVFCTEWINRVENSIPGIAGITANKPAGVFINRQGRRRNQPPAKRSAVVSTAAQRFITIRRAPFQRESGRSILRRPLSVHIRGSFLEEFLRSTVHLNGHTLHRAFLGNHLADRMRRLQAIQSGEKCFRYLVTKLIVQFVRGNQHRHD